MRRTSIEAYRQILADGTLRRQELVCLEYLHEHGAMNNRQILRGVRPMLRDVGVVSSVMARLVRAGAAYEVEEKKCPETGRMTIFFDITERAPVRLPKTKKIRCAYCSGKGYVEQGRLL